VSSIFSFCLQILLCIAFQNKENLFLPIFVIFLGRPGQFTCLLLFFSFSPCAVLSHGSCCSGAVNYGQSHKKNETVKLALQTVHHDFLGKDCISGSVLLYFFLFYLVITHARSPRRTCIKILLGLGAVPLEGHVHVNVSLLFVLHLLFTFTREK
jgi:hypothetical protein